MSLTTSQKINLTTWVIITYSLIFVARAAYWFHDRNAAIPAPLDTPVDLFVIGMTYVYRRHLVRSRVTPYNTQPSSGAGLGSKKPRTAGDYLAILILIAIGGFIVTGVLAFIAFGMAMSLHK